MKTKVRALIAAAAALANSQGLNAQEGLAKIKTIIVIYAENRSFDHLYGFFPGANGITNATAEQKTQIDHDGMALPHLTIFGPDGRPDARFPRMPNAPFRIDGPPINVPLDKLGPNPVHAFYHNREQINGGKNQSPITDGTRGTRLPDADRLWVSAGGTYKCNEQLGIEFAYSHIFIKDAPINLSAASGNPTFNPGLGTFIGTAGQEADVFSIGLRYRFLPPAPPVVRKG